MRAVTRDWTMCIMLDRPLDKEVCQRITRNLNEQKGAVETDGATYTRIFVTIPTSTMRMAMELSFKAARKAAAYAGQSFWPVGFQLVAPGAEPPVPELVGLAEIAERAGVSRQRASRLAASPGFPAPVVQLASGPIWSAPGVDRFLAGQLTEAGVRR